MNTQKVERDERTVGVENAGYSWGYLFLMFGLLIDSSYRGHVLHQSSWDCLGLVMAGGLITALYQVKHKVMTRTWIRAAALAAVVAAIVAVIFALFRLR